MTMEDYRNKIEEDKRKLNDEYRQLQKQKEENKKNEIKQTVDHDNRPTEIGIFNESPKIRPINIRPPTPVERKDDNYYGYDQREISNIERKPKEFSKKRKIK